MRNRTLRENVYPLFFHPASVAMRASTEESALRLIHSQTITRHTRFRRATTRDLITGIAAQNHLQVLSSLFPTHRCDGSSRSTQSQTRRAPRSN